MGTVTITDSTISNNATGINILNNGIIQNVALSNLVITGNGIGINAFNSGTIGEVPGEGVIYLDSVDFTGGNDTNVQCVKAVKLTSSDGTTVYCP